MLKRVSPLIWVLVVAPDFDTSRTFPEAVLNKSAGLQGRNAQNT
jgi:hypothetical protein